MSASESTCKEEINAEQNMCSKKLQIFWLLSEVSTAEGETIAFSRTESSCKRGQVSPFLQAVSHQPGGAGVHSAQD